LPASPPDSQPITPPVEVLEAGGCAVVFLQADSPDEVGVLLLDTLRSGTTLFLTDDGVYSDGSLRDTEGVQSHTPTSNLPAGTVLTLSDFETSVSGSVALSVSGDQVVMFTGSTSSPTFICALSTSGSWQSTADSSTSSALPLGLTDGEHAIALTHYDNYVYSGPTSGTAAALRAAIHGDPSNWSGSNSVEGSIPSGFTVHPPPPPPPLPLPLPPPYPEMPPPPPLREGETIRTVHRSRVEMIVAGDLSSITRMQLDAVAAAIATSAGVANSAVVVRALGASVRLIADVTVATAAAADAVTATLSTSLATSASATSVLWAAGVTVEAAPQVQAIVDTALVPLPATPPSSPTLARASPPAAPIIIGVVVPTVSLGLLMLAALWWHRRYGASRRRTRPDASPMSLRAPSAACKAATMTSISVH